jgi:hypothetical protein
VRLLKFRTTIAFLFVIVNALAQEDTLRIKKRFVPLMIASGTGYVSGVFLMNELWYKYSSRSSFHFFNDLHEWKQVDKAGHSFTTFIESQYAIRVLEWAGLSHQRAVIWGSLSGVILQTPIEILDGFSASYGASVSDLGANATGAILLFSQYKMWNEIRIQPKFSFHQTSLAQQRPNVLGDNLLTQTFKDYNGQTYWLSFNIYSFLKRRKSNFPKWLNISLGYGAHEMVYALPQSNKAAGYQSYRQYYFALDIDLTKIKTRNKFINSLLYAFNVIHLPSPAMEVNKYGIATHPFYF